MTTKPNDMRVSREGMSEQNKAVAVLIETFRDCLHRGKQPTFSAGDLKYFIEALLAPPADQQGEPAGWANENYGNLTQSI